MKKHFLLNILFYSFILIGIIILASDNSYSKRNNEKSKTLQIINDSNLYNSKNIKEEEIIPLDNNYALINNEDGNVIDYKNNKIVNIDELIKDRDKFKELVYSDLRIKYPKFVVDQVMNQKLNITYIDNKQMKLDFANENIEPPIEMEINVELTCREYKDFVMFNCNEEIENNLNNKVKNKYTVALTFDDGPCKNTYKAIEELNNNNMKATFFELGSLMKSYPEIVKLVKENGFEVASHGYSHKSFLKLGVNGTKKELEKTNEIYREITGEEISLVRPPYGSINSNIKDNTDTTFIKWSVDSLDWKEKDKFIDNIMNTVKDGDIILMHDIHKTSVDGLETLLPMLYSKGFDVVTVSELAEEKRIEIERNKIYFNFR